MAQAKTAKPKVEVQLPTSISKKHSVRFETDESGVPVTNIYLGMEAVRLLGNPRGVKVTVEALDQD